MSDRQPPVASEDPRTAPALRTWWQRRLLGLTTFACGLVALAGGVALFVSGVHDDGGGRIAVSILLISAGVLVVVVARHDVPKVVRHPRMRRTLAAGPWRLYEGQLLLTTWVSLSGEGEIGDDGPSARRWSLSDRDGTSVLLDERAALHSLQAVMRGEAPLWICGSPDDDPLVLAGADLMGGRTLRTDRDRARAAGRSTFLAPKAQHRTERSPRLPPA